MRKHYFIKSILETAISSAMAYVSVRVGYTSINLSLIIAWMAFAVIMLAVLDWKRFESFKRTKKARRSANATSEAQGS